MPASCQSAIPAFQLVAKAHLLRRDQAERGVIDLQIANQRRQAQGPPAREVGSYVLRSAVIFSICTGGGSLLKGRWCGSTTLIPSGALNHSFPSGDLATRGV